MVKKDIWFCYVGVGLERMGSVVYDVEFLYVGENGLLRMSLVGVLVG